MVDVIVTASSDQIDDIASYINLRKIKPAHACLLMGCKNPAILGVVESISNGSRRVRTHATKAILPSVVNGVTLKMTPGEFARIKQKLI
jgi:hypothetical protein